MVDTSRIRSGAEWVNLCWPNIAMVRSRIVESTVDPVKRCDLTDRFTSLMVLGLHAHIAWPLPPWRIIDRVDVRALIRWNAKHTRKQAHG
jgi:hypothetical protein